MTLIDVGTLRRIGVRRTRDMTQEPLAPLSDDPIVGLPVVAG
jgi:hypothetical protein